MPSQSIQVLENIFNREDQEHRPKQFKEPLFEKTLANGLITEDTDKMKERRLKIADFYRGLPVRMVNTEYATLELEEAIELGISHVALNCFNKTPFVHRLGKVKKIPEDLTDDAI